MDLWQHVKRFAKYTTMYGVSQIVASKATPKRLTWIVLCITAWIFFTIQMSYVLQSYFEYPKKLKTDIVLGGVPFPAITLCNLGSFDFYTVYKLSQGIALLNDTNARHAQKDNPGICKKKEETLLANNPYLNDTFIRAMYKYYRVWNESTSLNKTESMMIYYDKMFSRTTLSANIPTKMLSENGVQENEFIVKCTYRNKPRRFKKIFDPYFFNCYTFTTPNVTSNADNDPPPLLEGIENGLTVMLLAGTRMLKGVDNPDFSGMPGIYSKDSALSGAGGIRVVLHPPGTKPFPLTGGYDVPPNQMATLSLTPKRRKRLDQPYGNCNEKYPFLNREEQKHTGPYRRTACVKVCIQNDIHRECGCYENTLPTELDLLADQYDDAMTLNGSKQMNIKPKRDFTERQDYCFTEKYLEGQRNVSEEDRCKKIEKCSGTDEFHKCFKFYSPKLPTCDDG